MPQIDTAQLPQRPKLRISPGKGVIEQPAHGPAVGIVPTQPTFDHRNEAGLDLRKIRMHITSHAPIISVGANVA